MLYNICNIKEKIMPPKVRITKDDIIKTAIELVRRDGADALNVRAIAAYLGCSTQPVFSNFRSMDELFTETLNAAHGIYSEFLKKESESGNYPTYKAYGMAYVRFAGEERELFKLLFMRDRGGEEPSPTWDFEQSVNIICHAYC